MKTLDFLRENIGNKFRITNEQDAMVYTELRPLILNKTPMTLIRITKGGMAIVAEDNGNVYTVRPSNLQEY